MIQGTGCVLSVMLIAEHGKKIFFLNFLSINTKVFKQLIIANNAKELIEGATPQHAR